MSPGPPSPPAPPLRVLERDPNDRVVAGVCAGIARYLSIDPLAVRVAFAAAAAAGGLGLVAYPLAWVVMPMRGEARPGGRHVQDGRAQVEIALGAALLLLSVLLALRAANLWLSDAVVWPLVLIATGAALLWRQSLGTSPPPAPAKLATPPARHAVPRPLAEARRGAALVSRTGLGAALVVAAGVVFLQATGSLSAARDVVLAVLVVVAVLGVIFAPWVLRLVRSLAAERGERIRSQERAEMAAHLHDSVLQTLALVQKCADDPREVATLARRQERELRSWLSARAAQPDRDKRLGARLEQVVDEVERAHGVAVEAVTVGDCELDDAAEAVVAAAREAMVNAAKFGGGAPVAVYAEASDGRLHVFVRDRGPGFEPDAIPPDRRGVRESIVGRMRRAGGTASIRSSADAGTEVELTLERRKA
jgi:signal transduction histidine kinase/phage shock protein PspC (stress-responsive transcriptional regulator)